MSEELKDEEVKVGKDKVGMNTVVQLKVKTAVWLLGILWAIFSAAFGFGYYDLKKEIKGQNALMEVQKDKISDKVDQKLESVTSSIENIIKEQGEIKGDIKVILDRTGGRSTFQNNIQGVIRDISGIKVKENLPQ